MTPESHMAESTEALREWRLIFFTTGLGDGGGVSSSSSSKDGCLPILCIVLEPKVFDDGRVEGYMLSGVPDNRASISETRFFTEGPSGSNAIGESRAGSGVIVLL
jgi:hypothetical protein